MSHGYDAFEDPYSYPNSNVLQNLLDIREADRLEAFEVEISTLRATDESLPEGNFDALHYCAIHYHLFQDVYSWAGQYRTVRTSKGGNVFCYPEHIADQMTTLFARFENGKGFSNLPPGDFIRKIAVFLGDLNAIHPFREGNGRAQLAFVGLLGATFGHQFDFDKLTKDTFLRAMVASYSGQIDLLVRELTSLLV